MTEKKESIYKNLLLYFLLTFAWSWSFWMFGILEYFEIISLEYITFQIIMIIGGFGPLIGGFSSAFITRKKDGVISLFKTIQRVKIGLKWYIISLFLFPLIHAGGFILEILILGSVPNVYYYTQPWLILIDFVLMFFIGGPFQEEFGWRGYALPIMQQKWSAFISSLILGVIWGVWHLPLFYSRTSHSNEPFLLFLGQTILLAITFTWLFNNAKQSVLATMLFHTAWNMAVGLFPILSVIGVIFRAILLITTVLIILIFAGPKNMVRNETRKD